MKKTLFSVKKVTLLGALLGSALSLAPAFAANTSTQTVTYEVSAINEISVTGTPSLVVNSATAGSAPNAVTATGSYAITTNGTGKKITASINTAMPAGVTLTLTGAAPTGGTSAGAVTLGITAANLVTGITGLNESAKALTYSLSATSAAGVVASSSKTVTLTLVDGP